MAKDTINLTTLLNDPPAFIATMPQDSTGAFDFQGELTKLIAEGQATPENVSALTMRAQTVGEQATILASTTRKTMKLNEAGDQTVVIEEAMGFSVAQAVSAMRLLGKAYSDVGLLLRTMIPAEYSFDHATGALIKKTTPIRRTSTSTSNGGARARGTPIDYVKIDEYVRGEAGDDYCYEGFMPLFVKVGNADGYALLDLSTGKVRNGEYADDSVRFVNGDAKQEWDSISRWTRSVADRGGRPSGVSERAEVRVVWAIDPSKPEKYPTFEKIESLMD